MIKKINIILPILLLLILLFLNINEQFIYIMSLTLVIGWIIPYITLILTGIAMHLNSHKKLSLTLNILSTIVDIIIIIMMIIMYDKTYRIIIIEYIIVLIMNIINTYILLKQIIIPLRKETKKIKEEKNKNNGIIK